MDKPSDLLKPYEKIGKTMGFQIENGDVLTIMDDFLWLKNKIKSFEELKTKNPDLFKKMFLTELIPDSNYFGMDVISNIYRVCYNKAKESGNIPLTTYIKNQILDIVHLITAIWSDYHLGSTWRFLSYEIE